MSTPNERKTLSDCERAKRYRDKHPERRKESVRKSRKKKEDEESLEFFNTFMKNLPNMLKIATDRFLNLDKNDPNYIQNVNTLYDKITVLLEFYELHNGPYNPVSMYYRSLPKDLQCEGNISSMRT